MSVLVESYFPPSDADFVALESVLASKDESPLFRCQAAFSQGLILWDRRQRDDAAKKYRDAIRAGMKATAKERKELVQGTLAATDASSASIGEVTVGALLDELLENARGNISKMGSSSGARPSEMRSNGTAMPLNAFETEFTQGPIDHGMSTEELFVQLLSVGSQACDYCGKRRDLLEKQSVKFCGRCKQMHYCSKVHSRLAWKEGHKEHCREPGELKRGDYVRIKDIVSTPELNGRIVQIINPVPDRDNRWEVGAAGGTRTYSIASAKMDQFRPLR